MSDIFLMAQWWVLLFGLGIVFLPLTWFFFKRFFDLGYPFAKIIAILLSCYLVWVVGSLQILPFNLTTIIFIIFCLALFNLWLTKKHQKEFLIDLKRFWKILIFEEILFSFTLTFWSFIRGFQPDIEGLEKFMDFGFVNSILRSQFFPPADMWMAGKTINYYYFGHLASAVLTKLSRIDSATTYNLMIATIFALTFTAAFSLGGNLVFMAIRNTKYAISKQKKLVILGGLLSAVLLTVGGNLHTLWWFLTHNFSFADYWYPDATRFIVEKFGAADNTIHEFPIYSFVVSDLHGHVSNIPFVLLFLALLFSLLISNKFSIFNFQFSIPLALVLAVMYMTNAWDFPIYLLVLGLIILWVNYQRSGLTPKMLGKSLLFTIYYLLFTILFSLPFHLNFSQIAQGLDFVHARSPFWQLLVLWGYQWTLGLSFIVFLVLKKRITNYQPASPALSADRPAGGLPITDIYVLILLAVATFLIIIPEFIYVKDIYIASYHRANTMFKLVYQSFMLYALASSYIFVCLWTGFKDLRIKIPLFTLYCLLFTMVLVYPYFSVKSYYGDLKNYQGLYGLNFLKISSPTDLMAINWLKENVVGQPVVLEAVGDSYTDYNRVSATTGLPTIQGWLVHEWLWRGGFDEPGKRAAEVKTIYESDDLPLTKNLLEKYQVRYVFIGSKEKEKYQILEDKFMALGQIVFEQGNTRIYFFGQANNQ